jgi:hypothetical protein
MDRTSHIWTAAALSSTTNKHQQQTNISTSVCGVASIVDQTWRMSMVLGDVQWRIALGVRGGGQKSLGSAGAEGLSIQTPNLHQDIQYALPKRTLPDGLSTFAESAILDSERAPFARAIMPTIAISYRHEDTRWIVGRIFDHLVDHYGRDSVFMDIDGVPLGLDFRDQIRNTLQRSDILLAVIGPQWLAARKETGQPRIADEADWVRLEIEAALGKKIPIIPVLIDRTPLPKPNELPEALREFAYRQATNIDTGVDFQPQMDRLIRSMDELLGREDNGSRSLTANNRSPLTLLGNTQGWLAQRRMSSEFSSRTPLIREMIGQSSAWVIRQANIALEVIKSPKKFVSSIDLAAADALGKAVQFLFFVVMCNEILRLPLDVVVRSQLRMDPTLRMTWLIINILDPVLFGSAVWLLGKAVNGKGPYRNVLVAMLYSSAFMFLDTILAYIFLPHGGIDKQALLSALSGSSQNVGEFNTADAIFAFVTLIVSCYVYIKLASLVKFVHSIGAIRASLVLAFAYAADAFYVWFVGRPFLVDVVKGTIPN